MGDIRLKLWQEGYRKSEGIYRLAFCIIRFHRSMVQYIDDNDHIDPYIDGFQIAHYIYAKCLSTRERSDGLG